MSVSPPDNEIEIELKQFLSIVQQTSHYSKRMSSSLENISSTSLFSNSIVYHLLNVGPIRMYILMDTRNVEQTRDVRMYIEEFILVDVVTLLYKLELNMHWKNAGLYTLVTKD